MFFLSSRCLSVLTEPWSLDSHGDGAAAINMHQVLEKEGVLLFNCRMPLVTGMNILSNIYGDTAFSSSLP